MATALDNFTTSLKGMFLDGGGAEKAVLYIYLVDVDQPQNVEEEIKYVKNLEHGLLAKLDKKLSVKDAISNTASGVWDSLKEALTPGSGSSQDLGKLFQEADNNLKGKSEEDGGDKDFDLDPTKSNFLKFKVQYNPATIRLSSINGKVQSRRAEEGIENLKIYNFTGKSKLSFDLVFDDTDNMNAFGMNELTNMNFTSAINKGIDTFKKGKEGLTGDYSVKPKMDAILSLLCSAVTQEVVFFWSKMVFRGTVTDVSNRFTMFNSKGNPVRGEMHLELTQDKKKTEQGYDDSYWKKAFSDVFKEQKPGSDLTGASSSNTLQKFTNNSFMNINI